MAVRVGIRVVASSSIRTRRSSIVPTCELSLGCFSLYGVGRWAWGCAAHAVGRLALNLTLTVTLILASAGQATNNLTVIYPDNC